MPSKSTALFEWAILLLLLLLLPVASRAQDDTPPWFWIMADSVGDKIVCPGLCLAVNDSASAGDYDGKPVGFVACETSDSSNSDETSTPSNTNSNQQWLRDDDNKTTIRINATGSTETGLLCLQPDPTTNRSLAVTKCNGRSNQKWIVANNTVASLAFDPPRSLAMSYRVTGFLSLTNGGDDMDMAWREASVVAGKPRNSSLTTTFSMVEGDNNQNLDLNPPEDKEPTKSQSRNFIWNGGFEKSSYDFPNASTNLSLTVNDVFGLCYWKVVKSEANLRNGPSGGPAPPEGNRSLYIKDGIVSQKVTTLPGAFYTIVFKVAVATSSPSSSDTTESGDDTCRGSDTLSVNPYPSTNVDMAVEVSNKSWVTNHVSFQALGMQVQLAFKGCSACGCYLDEVNLMQVIDHAPFPPPPRQPSLPPLPPLWYPNVTNPPGPPGFYLPRRPSGRLSNAAVVGVVVGAAALFFVIGAACFAVVCLSKKEKGEVETIETRRPAEWSIHTTTPARSERTKESASGSIHQASSNAPTSAVGATMSSSNTQSGSAPSAP